MKYQNVKELYIQLAIADTANKILFGDNVQGQRMFMDRLIDGLKQLYYESNISDWDEFKFAVQSYMGMCYNDSELTKLYGKKWFATPETFLKIFQIFENVKADNRDGF